MAINTEHNNAPSAPESQAKTASTGFASAPTGSGDIFQLINDIGISRIDSSIEPYLKEVNELIGQKLHNVTYVSLRLQNSFAFRYQSNDGYVWYFGIQFVAGSDPIHQDMLPASMKLRTIDPEIAEREQGRQARLVDARVIMSGYAPEMARTKEMADTIVRAFNAVTKPEIRDATSQILQTNKIMVSWNAAEARNYLASLSPHAVPPRGDIGLVLKVKPSVFGNDRVMRDFENDAVPIAAIMGYVEIRQPVPYQVPGTNTIEQRFLPTFNITAINSVLPIVGMGGLLLAALAPAIYNTKYWLNQWVDLNGSAGNPGFLVASKAKSGQPEELNGKEDLLAFAEGMFAPIQIVNQQQDGRDIIPGFWRMMSDNIQDRQTFLNQMAKFFGVTQDVNANGDQLTNHFEFRFDGVYGQKDGTLLDSRNFDYLSVAKMLGFAAVSQTPDYRNKLLGVPLQPKDRAVLVSELVHGNFTPLWLTNLAFINPKLIETLSNIIRSAGITIEDPTSVVETASIGSFISGFGSTSGIASILSSGQTQRGINVASMWR